ncbi:MAG: hypothetical protein XD61_1357, partial [Thermococcus sp. 40_45]
LDYKKVGQECNKMVITIEKPNIIHE